MKRKRELLASGVIQLDPLDCDSTVAYTIRRGRRGVNGSIGLSDCDRKICWYFDRGSGLNKIDAAISILAEFRKKFCEETKRRN